MLLVTCEVTQTVVPFAPAQVGCTYPFQGYGETFLLAAGLVGTLAFVPISRIAHAGGRELDWNPGLVALIIDTGPVSLYVAVRIVT